ncbi:methionine gamma-lyase family protein [Proteocatella sphenisci]|uniref:methionine gamma-lyase family protein n=1 Tax=Proteocatella sphenisci TaxID=181070 RepID=UPI00048D712F|nr:methionine gamma-lyase family protein [Proteocatella sphenisci]
MQNILDEFLQNSFDIRKDIIDETNKIEDELNPIFLQIDKIKEYNSLKVLDAMRKSRLSDTHFSWNTGYGYNDAGREKTEEIFTNIFKSEDSIVRPTIVNGTHALTLCLQGILKSGFELISISSKPYDTLDQVIGISDSYHSLKGQGVIYKQIDLLENGDFDYPQIEEAIKSSKLKKMVYIQRSKGYSRRKSIMIDDIEKVVKFVKSIDPEAIVMVDNCYGEFIETREPIEAGADVIAGSLIKNPGGGLAIAGGYICGRRDLIDIIAQRMTSPGIGKECGLTFGTTRTLLQGLFLAPMIVSNAKKGAVFCAKLFEHYGYDTFPLFSDERSDIIQSVGLKSKEEIVNFCKGIQKAAPVDSFVTPEPWAMPGYDSEVIMAAGAFIQGSSIELSADAPIKEPYTVYFQGGLTYEHSKIGAQMALNEILK